MSAPKPFGALTAAILACALSACGGTPNDVAPTKGPLPTPTPVGIETPGAGAIYLGAYVPPGPGGISTLEAAIGRKLALDMHYYPWISLFPGLQESADFANGRLSVESWDCGIPNAQVAAGAADPLIATRALALKSFGHPIFLRYMWDMNLPATALNRQACYDPATDNPDGSFSATQYVAAWNHMRQIFAQNNVTNVIWVWSVSAPGPSASAYYPGDSQVDWIGSDTYDTGGTDFPTMFSPAYQVVSPFGKPVLIGETGASKGTQPPFFASVVPALTSQFPLVKGFIYHDAPNMGTNWSIILPTSSGQAAFAALAADPYLSAFGTL
ncbi:MAG: hypothetical protein M3R51_02905 [Candidatus Eremiobacteraeota bacterium]|nr:hypothetical protein [Candidatus Eremiobacteraeota bacterium]